MHINSIIGAALCAFAVAACNDASNTGNQTAGSGITDDARNTASAPSIVPPDTLPAAVPVPPASTSPVVTGAIEEPAASETPVDYAKLAASTIDPTVQVTTRSPAEPSATQSTPSSGPAETKSGTDSPETAPLSTLSPAEQSKSMPMAGHGNNHSSPSLEQGAKN